MARKRQQEGLDELQVKVNRSLNDGASMVEAAAGVRGGGDRGVGNRRS
jgi:hypothetical protein